MSDLKDLLERTAAHTPVGPPPLDALRAGAARRRRRRTAGLAGTAAVTAAAVIGATTLLASPDMTAPVTSPVVPAMRLVGFGHAAIAIPADWPTNKSQCGTPRQDTLLLDDPSAALFCMSYRPPGVESVGLYYGRPRADFHADETFEIDGVRAERQRMRCETITFPKPNAANFPKGNVTTCVSTVSIPSLNVWFQAESSTSAGEVGKLLERIQIVPDRTGVPSYRGLGGTPTGSLVAKYAPVLAKAGLKAQYMQMNSPSYPTGTILGVSPAAGTMLPVGSTVMVIVAK